MIASVWAGYWILVGALLINLACKRLNVQTWYSYFELIQAKGFGPGSREVGIGNLVWLYVLYPLSLGATAVAALALLERILKPA